MSPVDNDSTVAATGDPAAPEPTAAPLLTIVSGNPTDEEVAALTAVITAAAAATPASGNSGPRDDWGRPSDLHRPAWGMPTSYSHRG